MGRSGHLVEGTDVKVSCEVKGGEMDPFWKVIFYGVPIIAIELAILLIVALLVLQELKIINKEKM